MLQRWRLFGESFEKGGGFFLVKESSFSPGVVELGFSFNGDKITEDKFDKIKWEKMIVFEFESP